jgi:hypothetical protein
MNCSILFSKETSALRNSIICTQLRRNFLLLLAALACFALSPQARAVCSEGCDIPKGNTILGDHALYFNTTGESNSAIGSVALLYNTSGSANTALGYSALFSNTTGGNNTANGFEALDSNDSGNNNTASGGYALFSNVGGNYNMAAGFTTLYHNTSGNYNTASGAQALLGNTSGNDNTADGGQALISNTTGSNNTGTGAQALFSNKAGHDNAASGFSALLRNTSGSFNIGLGSNAGGNLTTGSNNIDIGNVGVAAESNTIRIGKSGTQQKTFVAGISGKTVASGVGVIINSSGQMGTIQSSAHYKDDIKPMEEKSETLLKLKPVTFHYKKELDPDRIPQFGLIAEEVEKVNPDLVVRDEDGKVMTVRYEAVNAMLLNEFLKEHRKVQQLEANSLEQQEEIKSLAATVEKQASQIQKVTANLDLCRPAPQTVANNQ